MKTILGKWVGNHNGATAIEYGLIMAGVALAVLVGAFAFGDNLEILFTTLNGYLD